ncbi:hypothetical protein RIF29_25324 [Crotalaria pallida]|uniref:Uncharacterized protein n=1 Tax=Crotalaria pallida TaxID=3830 RepID=A0AAN9ENS9_CROPI
MAKKRGRPPKTPSSSAKKTPSKTLEDHEDKSQQDLKPSDAPKENVATDLKDTQNESGKGMSTLDPSNDTVIAESENINKDEGIETEHEVTSKEDAAVEEVPWTPVQTRNRGRNEQHKGNSPLVNKQASKANG